MKVTNQDENGMVLKKIYKGKPPVTGHRYIGRNETGFGKQINSAYSISTSYLSNSYEHVFWGVRNKRASLGNC